MRAGRKPGTLVRIRCRVCSDVKLATGGSHLSRCGRCIAAGLGLKRVGCQRDAHSVVAAAIRGGALARPDSLRCTDCDAAAAQYDHRDYNKPLDVEPVCRRCNLRRGPGIPPTESGKVVASHGTPPHDLRAYLGNAGRGAGTAIARALGVHPVMVSQWATGTNPISEDRAPDLERATGFRVRCETSCPDAVWVRVPDPDWPGGRPLLDKASVLPATPAEAQA
jgi:hypothetical protein